MIVIKKIRGFKTKKFSQVNNNTSKGTLYEVGSKFYRSNQTSKKINMKQIHFGSYKLCNQVSRGEGIWNQYYSIYNQIFV